MAKPEPDPYELLSPQSVLNFMPQYQEIPKFSFMDSGAQLDTTGLTADSAPLPTTRTGGGGAPTGGGGGGSGTPMQPSSSSSMQKDPTNPVGPMWNHAFPVGGFFDYDDQGQPQHQSPHGNSGGGGGGGPPGGGDHMRNTGSGDPSPGARGGGGPSLAGSGSLSLSALSSQPNSHPQNNGSCSSSHHSSHHNNGASSRFSITDPSVSFLGSGKSPISPRMKMELIDDDGGPMFTMHSPSRSASRGRGGYMNGGGSRPFGGGGGGGNPFTMPSRSISPSARLSRSRSALRVAPPHNHNALPMQSSSSQRIRYLAQNGPMDNLPLQFQSHPSHARGGGGGGRDHQHHGGAYGDDANMTPSALPPQFSGRDHHTSMPSAMPPSHHFSHHRMPSSDGASIPPSKRPRVGEDVSGDTPMSSGSGNGTPRTTDGGASDDVNGQVLEMVTPGAAGGGVLYACTCAIKSKAQCLLHNVAARNSADSSDASNGGAGAGGGPQPAAAVMPAGGADGASAANGAQQGAGGQQQMPQSRAGRKKVDYACQNCRNSKVGCDEYLGVSRQCTRCFRLGKVCIRTGRGTSGNPKKNARRRPRRKPNGQPGQAGGGGRKRARPNGQAVTGSGGAMVLKGDVAKAPPRISIDTWTVAAGGGNDDERSNAFVPDLSKTRLAEIADITVAQLAKMLPSVGASTKNTQLLHLLASLSARSVSSNSDVEDEILKKLKPASDQAEAAASPVSSPARSPCSSSAAPSPTVSLSSKRSDKVAIKHDYVESGSLQKKADEASKLLASLPVGVFYSDYEHSDDGKTCRVYYDFNEKVCSIYGLTRDEVQDRIVGGYSSLVHHADWEVHLREECEAAMKAPTTWESTRQCCVVGKDGRAIAAIKVKRITFNERALPISRTTLIIPLTNMKLWPSAQPKKIEEEED